MSARCLDTVVVLNPQGYSYCGGEAHFETCGAAREFVTLAVLEVFQEEDLIGPLLAGTLRGPEIEYMESEMEAHASACMVNHVRIAKRIRLRSELRAIRRALRECDVDHTLDHPAAMRVALSKYCHYRLGAYEVFSMQIDGIA